MLNPKVYYFINFLRENENNWVFFLISGFEHEFRNLWVPLQNRTFSSRQFDQDFQDPSVLGQRLLEPGTVWKFENISVR